MEIAVRAICLLMAYHGVCSISSSQTAAYVYRNKADSTSNCYLFIKPERNGIDSIKGLVVRDYTRLPNTDAPSPYRLAEYLLDSGWAVLYTATSTVYPDLYYNEYGPALLDSIIHEVVYANRIDPSKIVVGGLSASGTRALRYAQWCAQGRSPFGHRVVAVFAVDPPLDLERFYRSAKRIVERNIATSMLDEARTMLRVLPQMVGASPDVSPSAYVTSSVYSHSDEDGGNARWLTTIPIRFYHEPDIDWWLSERSADYYDINSIDIVGCAAQIRALGGKSVEVITTMGKGFDGMGKRKPHSWTIVDEKELVAWIVNTSRREGR